MSRPSLETTFDACLKELDAGIPLEEILSRRSNQAEALRGPLEAAQMVRQHSQQTLVSMRAQAASKQRFLAQAAQLRNQGSTASLWWNLMYFFRRHAGSAALAAAVFALLFVALNSLQSLPGDGLYPVKQAAEQASISLSGSPELRAEREAYFDTIKATEIARMIEENRTGPVQLAGFLSQPEPGEWETDGVLLKLNSDLTSRAVEMEGLYVEVQGALNQEGRVDVQKIEPRITRLSGTLQSVDNSLWKVDDTLVRITERTKVYGSLETGSRVNVQAARVEGDPPLIALEVSFESTSPRQEPTGIQTPESKSTPAPTLTPSQTLTREPSKTVKPATNDTPDDDDSEQENRGDDDHDNSGKGSDNGDDSGGDNNDDEGDGNSGKGGDNP